MRENAEFVGREINHNLFCVFSRIHASGLDSERNEKRLFVCA